MKQATCLVVLLVLGSPAGAQPVSDQGGETVIVASALDGDTLSLVDGRRVRLAGIAAPKAAPEERGQADRDLGVLAATARDRLASLSAGRRVTLHPGAGQTDRHGRIVAQLVADGSWIQAELLRHGLARVENVPEAGRDVAALLAIEDGARRSRHGIWSHPSFRIQRPDEAGRRLDTFQIVEGQIAAIRRAGSGLRLVFAGEREPAFAVSVPRGARTILREAGLDAESSAGETVRVRGWIGWRDGPFIEVAHPAQIERLARRRGD